MFFSLFLLCSFLFSISFLSFFFVRFIQFKIRQWFIFSSIISFKRFILIFFSKLTGLFLDRPYIISFLLLLFDIDSGPSKSCGDFCEFPGDHLRINSQFFGDSSQFLSKLQIDLALLTTFRNPWKFPKIPKNLQNSWKFPNNLKHFIKLSSFLKMSANFRKIFKFRPCIRQNYVFHFRLFHRQTLFLVQFKSCDQILFFFRSFIFNFISFSVRLS